MKFSNPLRYKGRHCSQEPVLRAYTHPAALSLKCARRYFRVDMKIAYLNDGFHSTL